MKKKFSINPKTLIYYAETKYNPKRNEKWNTPSLYTSRRYTKTNPLQVDPSVYEMCDYSIKISSITASYI